MKKTIRTVISLFLAAVICSSTFAAYAVSGGSVYAETVRAVAGEIIEIPVYIKNNPGLMGYKFIISYDNAAMSPMSVVQGNALAGGNFNDSIETSMTSEFAVLWSGTSESKGNGLLFTVSFKTSAEAKGKYTVRITYSNDDTFNESWEDVILECDNITIDFGGTKVENVPIPASESTFWEKIVAFFEMVIDFIINLLN